MGANPLVWDPLVSSICKLCCKSREPIGSNGTHYSNGSSIARGKDPTHMLDVDGVNLAIRIEVAIDGKKVSAGTGIKTSTPLDKAVPDIVDGSALVSGVAR